MSDTVEPVPGRRPTPVPAEDPALIEALRADLVAASWSVETVEELMGPVASAALAREQRIPALVALHSRAEPAAILTRVFMLGSHEGEPALARALPTLGVDGALALGLLLPNGYEGGEAVYRAAFDLRPHAATLPGGDGGVEHHWWIMSDLAESVTGQALQVDHVLGIGGATTSLLRLTLRERVDRALDLGCGCGIQALYLATHARHVVATDLSRRACVFTRINALLNGVDLEVREGSLFEPVAGESFDLIVSNPPFVITPEAVRAAGVLEYRDGGMERDNLVATVLREAPAHLEVGGTVQILANWEVPTGADPASCEADGGWPGRVAGWLHGLEMDAWVVQRDVLDPAEYAELWLRDSGGQLLDRACVETAYAEWLADFAKAGVCAIGMGFIVARKVAPGAAPVHVFDLVEGGRIPTGIEVEAALASFHLPAALEELVLVRAADVTEERHYTPGEEDPRVMILHQGGGMGQSIAVGTAVSALVGVADGELSVGQVIAALAALTGQEVEHVADQILPVLPYLLRSGMLSVKA